MASKYDADLQEVMRLIIEKAPKTEILEKAREIKVEITRAWSDAQQAIGFLDQMINRYASDPEYPQGFWLEAATPAMVRPGIAFTPSSLRQPKRPSIRITFDNSHILEIAGKLSSNGTVKTKAIAGQLRTEGDPRPEMTLLKSIGNILSRNNWTHAGTGVYRQPEQKEGKEIKETQSAPLTP